MVRGRARVLLEDRDCLASVLACVAVGTRGGWTYRYTVGCGLLLLADWDP